MGIFFAKQQLSKIAVSSHNNNNNNNIHYTAISNISTPFNGVSQCRYCNSSSLTQPTSLLGGWDGGRGTVQYTTVLACAEDLHSSDAHGLYSTKKLFKSFSTDIF